MKVGLKDLLGEETRLMGGQDTNRKTAVADCVSKQKQVQMTGTTGNGKWELQHEYSMYQKSENEKKTSRSRSLLLERARRAIFAH